MPLVGSFRSILLRHGRQYERVAVVCLFFNKLLHSQPPIIVVVFLHRSSPVLPFQLDDAASR